MDEVHDDVLERLQMPREEADRRLKLADERKVNTGANKRIAMSRTKRFVPPVVFSLMAHLAMVCPTPRTMGLYLCVGMEMRRRHLQAVRVQDNQLEALGLTSRSTRARAINALENLGLLEVERRNGYAPLLTARVPEALGIIGRAF